MRHLGLSEAAAETVPRASAMHPVAALQSEYSLWSRDVEREILPTCRQLGVGFVAYSPLGRGFLTGRFRRPEDLEPGDHRRTMPRFQGENFQRNLDLAARVEAMAREKGCTAAQLALAWVLHRGSDIVPIPGPHRLPRGKRGGAGGGADPAGPGGHRRRLPAGGGGGAALRRGRHGAGGAVAPGWLTPAGGAVGDGGRRGGAAAAG